MKMKKKITILICAYLIIPIHLVLGQESAMNITKASEISKESTKKNLPFYEFNTYSLSAQLENITEEMAGNHEFGLLIAKKLYLLDERYVSEVAVVPGNPQTRTVIKKPAIYESVKKVEKYLRRSVKKGGMPLNIAISDLNKVLDVALSVSVSETGNFEKELQSIDNVEEKIALFTERVYLKLL
jgi:hypothetical protein